MRDATREVSLPCCRKRLPPHRLPDFWASNPTQRGGHAGGGNFHDRVQFAAAAAGKQRAVTVDAVFTSTDNLFGPITPIYPEFRKAGLAQALAARWAEPAISRARQGRRKNGTGKGEWRR